MSAPAGAGSFTSQPWCVRVIPFTASNIDTWYVAYKSAARGGGFRDKRMASTASLFHSSTALPAQRRVTDATQSAARRIGRRADFMEGRIRGGAAEPVWARG